MQFAISAVVAVATPAIAAGLVAGTSVAMGTSGAAIGNTIYPGDEEAPAVATPIATAPIGATHGPARLNVLVGNDQSAWDSVHSVHVNFSHKPH